MVLFSVNGEKEFRFIFSSLSIAAKVRPFKSKILSRSFCGAFGIYVTVFEVNVLQN